MECPTPGLMPGGLEGLRKELVINSAAITWPVLYSMGSRTGPTTEVRSALHLLPTLLCGHLEFWQKAWERKGTRNTWLCLFCCFSASGPSLRWPVSKALALGKLGQESTLWAAATVAGTWDQSLQQSALQVIDRANCTACPTAPQLPASWVDHSPTPNLETCC